jgi:prepilin-type N-terminal cleavage/methylation domain-containing protein
MTSDDQNMIKRRRGFTLIELLVVIAIIGVVIALLLPAVQKVREAANRAKCSSNLHNVGLALHHFHDVNGKFPPGGVTGPLHGWVAFLLPYLEQKPIADLYHWEVNSNDSSNWAAYRTQLRILQCPSAEPDRVHPNYDQAACIDYAAIKGVDPILAERGWIKPVGNYDGAMPVNFMARVADITDGTSQTIMIAEDAGRPQIWRAGRLGRLPAPGERRHRRWDGQIRAMWDELHQ